MKDLNRSVIAVIWLSVFFCSASSQVVNIPRPGDKQESGKGKGSLSDRPAEIVNVVNQAGTTPPEFAADILIRLAQSSKVRDPAWKREMLTEAFRLASKSDQKIKRSYAGAVMDTREGYLALSLAQDLDVLSLQSRSVAAMLAVDKGRAREMFNEMSPDLKIPTLNCPDALVPDVSGFYDVMKRVSQEALTPAEIREGTALWFIQRYIQALNSPAQVGPIAKAIAALNLPPDQSAVLIRSLSEALKRTSGDYRTFSSATFRDSLGRSFQTLAEVCDRLEIPKQDLLQSLRGYVIRNLASAQCADASMVQSKALPGFVVAMNRDLLKATPISLDDIPTASVQESIQTTPFWESPKSKDLLNKLRRLRFSSEGRPRTDDEKASDAWHQELTDFLIDLEAWSANDEKSEVDYFHEKAIVYRVLSDVAPPGEMRDKIWRNNASFLAEGYLPRNRIEWYMHAAHFFDRVRALKGKDRADLIAILTASTNGVLRSYAYLDDVLSE
jgi:hypothetical protein